MDVPIDCYSSVGFEHIVRANDSMTLGYSVHFFRKNNSDAIDAMWLPIEIDVSRNNILK